MKTITLSRASRSLAAYATELGGEVMVVIQRNRPVAAVVPLKGLDAESLALSAHPEFLELIARSRAEIRRGQTISLKDMRRALSAEASSNKRLQPTKARRTSSKSKASRPRLRG